MSRHGYSEYDDEYDHAAQWAYIRWRGMVTSAIRGKRGQALLRETVEALDAMPVKVLVAGEFYEGEADVSDPDQLENVVGAYCTLGVVGAARGLDMQDWTGQVEDGDFDEVAETFNIAPALAREIMWWNDEGGPWNETPDARWKRMRQWLVRQLRVRSDG